MDVLVVNNEEAGSMIAVSEMADQLNILQRRLKMDSREEPSSIRASLKV